MANTPLSLVRRDSKEELRSLWKKSKVPAEKAKFRFLWKICPEGASDTALAMPAEAAAESVGRSADWGRRTVRAYNAEGAASVEDGRKGNRRPKIASEAQVAELKAKVASGESPDGGLWT